MTNPHATAENVHGEYRRRPYVGRYAPPPLPAPKPVPTIAQRIAILIESAGMARNNARLARRSGDEASARHAFYRAHDYLEMARELRDKL